MKHRSIITFLSVALICTVLACCSKDDGTVTIRVVATSDVHGRIFDKDILTGEERDGSLAKFSSFLKGQRKEYDNVIYLDAGDILQGSVEAYQDMTSQFFRESLAAQAYNILGCDATVMGNHDFAVGAVSYDRFFRGLTFPVLGANAFYDEYGDFLPPYRIRAKQGVRVAILGLTTPIVNYSIPADRMELDVADIVETARYWVPVLKEKEEADVVIGLLHSGFDNGRMDDEGLCENAVSRLVSEVPGLDIIIFGHDHKECCLKMVDCNGDSVQLLNPGPFARKAAVATLTVTKGETPVVSIHGELADITAEKPDRRFLRKLSGWFDDVMDYSDSVIGTVTTPLESAGVLWRSSSVMDWVHSVQMQFNGAEISLSSPVLTKTYIPSGDVRVKDMFDVYHFDNTMVSVMMSGNEVRDVLEYSAGLFYNTVSDGNGGLLKTKPDGDGECKLPQYPVKNLVTAAGVDYEIDVTKPQGNRVSIISMSDGRPFEPEKMYRTTINSFLYSSKESALFKAMGIGLKDMRKRLNGSSMADIRYFMLTDLALRHELGIPVTVRNITRWKLVPEETVSGCLAKDTVDFNIIGKQTSHIWD